MKLFFLSIILIILQFSCTKEIIQHQLIVSVTPIEGGSVTPSSSSYEKGQSVQLLATPASNYVFKEWTGDLSGSINPSTLIIDNNKVISCLFVKRQFPLNLTVEESGSVKEEIIGVSARSQYPSGTTVRLSPQPLEGWEFSGWTGDVISTSNPLDIKIEKAISLKAFFQQIKFPGYKVDPNARKLGTDYWENSTLPSDLIVAVFQKNYENIHPSGAYAGWTVSICNGDFNNDGYMDVFNAGSAHGGKKENLTFLIWNPSKTIFEEKNLINDKINFVGNPRLVTPVYLNSDNYVDLVIHGMRDEASDLNPNEPVSICLSDGKGGYDITKLDLEPKSLANQFGHEWGDVEDVNGDGLPDLFVSANSHSYIFWGISTFPYFTNINFAHFSSDTKNFVSDNSFGEVVPSGAGAVYGGVFLDVNKDGQKDLLLAVGEGEPDGKNNQQRVLLNKGKGKFNETGIIKLPLFSMEINAGINQFDYKVDDLNEDGRLDIIAVNSVKYSQWNIVIYMQQIDGSFVIDNSWVEYNINTNSRPSFKTRLIFYDFNGDGRKDISYINSATEPYYRLQNNPLLTKSVFIRVGNKFVEKDYYQFDTFAKQLKEKYYK